VNNEAKLSPQKRGPILDSQQERLAAHPSLPCLTMLPRKNATKNPDSPCPTTPSHRIHQGQNPPLKCLYIHS